MVFTVPPLAAVGLQEADAHTRSLSFWTNFQETSGRFSSRPVGLRYSAFKLLVEEQSDGILGAHLLGVHAEEVINLFVLAIRMRVPATELKHMVYNYPTSSSDVVYML